MMEYLFGIDYAAVYHFNANPIALFDITLPYVSVLAGYPILALVILIGAIWLRRQQRFNGMIFLIGCSICAIILSEITKVAIHRPHPDSWQGSAWLGYSFPSSGAMLSAVVYLGTACILFGSAGRLWRIVLWIITICVVTLIAFSLIYTGQNWVSDILAGWAGAAAILFAGLWRLNPNQELSVATVK